MSDEHKPQPEAIAGSSSGTGRKTARRRTGAPETPAPGPDPRVTATEQADAVPDLVADPLTQDPLTADPLPHDAGADRPAAAEDEAGRPAAADEGAIPPDAGHGGADGTGPETGPVAATGAVAGAGAVAATGAGAVEGADIPPATPAEPWRREPWDAGTDEPFDTASGTPAQPGSGRDTAPMADEAPDLLTDPLPRDPLTADPLARPDLSAEAEIPAEGTIPAEAPEIRTPDPAPHPMPTAAMAAPKASGFLPTLAGGILAAALGGGVAWYLLTQMAPQPAPDPEAATLGPRLNEQAGQISQLRAEIARLAAAPPPAPTGGTEALSAEIAALREQLQASEARGTDLTQRLAALESRPEAAGGGAVPTEIAAALREQIGRNDALAADLRRLEETTGARLDTAVDQGRRAAADALIARISLAVTAGEAYAPLLDQAGPLALTLPEALRAHAAGVPDEAGLKTAFPAAARAGLDAASLANAQGAGLAERTGAFLRNQLGIRSLAPRDGTSPDAILSRMQAAVDEGRFEAALTEAAALPPAGRDAMTEWLDGARARVDALGALAALQAQLGQ